MHEIGSGVSRRHFLMETVGGAIGLSLTGLISSCTNALQQRPETQSIKSIRVGVPSTVPNNFGDTWAVAWADDDHLYSPSNDTLGFGIPDFLDKRQIRLFQSDFERFCQQLTPDQKEEFQYDPISFNRIQGTDPLSLQGTTVNRMREYARQDHADALFSPDRRPSSDGRSWKSSGCTFVDGALYWTVARHKYPSDTQTAGLRQNAANASILKSTDYGKTWTRAAEETFESPMFGGSSFATAYLIDYCRSREPVDGSDRYVYAISNNGYWDNGDTLILGRVSRPRLGLLKGSDWEYFTGGDGLNEECWKRDVALAKPILSNTGKLGETGAVYLPSRRRYMMIGWYYPAGSGYLKGSSSKTVWDFYEAPKPWGPWTLVTSHTWDPQGYYCPSICPKFQSRDRVYVLTAGDFNNWWDYYHLTVVPIELG